AGLWPTPTTVSPGSGAARRTPSVVAPGARRSGGAASIPAARAIASAVCRARRSGEVRTASGRSRASSAARTRACSRPSDVSARSSSGSPGAASAWRTSTSRMAASIGATRRLVTVEGAGSGQSRLDRAAVRPDDEQELAVAQLADGADLLAAGVVDPDLGADVALRVDLCDGDVAAL